jgi:hypothetical protein
MFFFCFLCSALGGVAASTNAQTCWRRACTRAHATAAPGAPGRRRSGALAHHRCAACWRQAGRRQLRSLATQRPWKSPQQKQLGRVLPEAGRLWDGPKGAGNEMLGCGRHSGSVVRMPTLEGRSPHIRAGRTIQPGTAAALAPALAPVSGRQRPGQPHLKRMQPLAARTLAAGPAQGRAAAGAGVPAGASVGPCSSTRQPHGPSTTLTQAPGATGVRSPR